MNNFIVNSEIDFFNLLFPILSKFKPTDYANFNEKLKTLNKRFPKKSKTLTGNYFKDIININEPRLLVIIGHLYIDYLLSKYISKNDPSIRQKRIDRMRFKQKLEYVNKNNLISKNNYETMDSLNKLRNQFAHDIFYTIENWNAKTIPYVVENNLHIPKRKDLLKQFNIAIIKTAFQVILVQMTKTADWINLENMK